jgi:hypothetical protein
MNVTLEFLVVFTVAILPQIVGSFLSIKDREYFRKFTPEQRTVSNLGRWIGIIFLLFYIAMNHSNGLFSIGLGFGRNGIPKIILVAGITTGYLLLIFVLGRLRSKKIQEQTETVRRSIFAAGAFSTYRGFWGRSAYLLTLWLGVIAEDLVFRGYLVLGLVAQTGDYFLWIVLSIALSIAAHLYQGTSARLMLGQGLFALIFIGVSLITNNVITAIIPHLVYDTVWLLRGWAKDSKDEVH